MDSWYQRDAIKLAEDIKAAIPEATVENWRDYKFAVDVMMPDGRACVACEPEIDIDGWKRPGIWRNIDEVKRILGIV